MLQWIDHGDDRYAYWAPGEGLWDNYEPLIRCVEMEGEGLGQVTRSKRRTVGKISIPFASRIGNSDLMCTRMELDTECGGEVGSKICRYPRT